jgi:glutaredoxin
MTFTLPPGRLAPWLALAAALSVSAAHAQYKVVGPDGKITYTDRVPTPSDGKATALGARGSAGPSEVPLPAELRQVASRYPATLYVTAGACAPCDAARQLLRQRGIPFSEKIVAPEDGEAIQRLTGGRDAPTLTLGSQALRGLSAETWNSYLDAAGYPRESRLPSNYRNPEPAPLTPKRQENMAGAAPAPATPPTEPAPATSSTETPGGVTIRF